MKLYIKNQNGVTLVELLAVIVITGFILVLISNIHFFGQKQYKDQTQNTGNLNNLTYTMKVITKEIRKSKDVKVVSPNEMNLDDVQYKFDSTSKSINKDGMLFIADVKDFKIQQSGEELRIEITNLSNKKLKTTILVRGG